MDNKKYISVNINLTPEQAQNIAILQKAIYTDIGYRISKKEVYISGLRTLAKKLGVKWAEDFR